MYGLEKIDLSVAKPFPSQNLTPIAPPKGVSYVSLSKSWAIEKGKTVGFKYKLPRQKAINLSLCLQVESLTPGKAKCPISLTCNGNTVFADFDPVQNQLIDKTWFVPAFNTLAGDNNFEITVGNAATARLFVKELRVGNFVIQAQIQTNWCWNATGLSVLDYLKRSANTDSQCTMYNKVKNTKHACQPERADPDENLNRCGWPSDVLHIAQHPNTEISYAISWNELLVEMDANRPVICIIEWAPPSNGGHAVVISSAYAMGRDQMVIVDDPWFGVRNVIKYQDLLTSYKKTGDTWTKTVLCK